MYTITLKKKLGEKLQKFPPSDQKKIYKVLQELKIDPLPKGKDIKKLQGKQEVFWRYRIGNICLIYTLDTENNILDAVYIDYRGHIY